MQNRDEETPACPVCGAGSIPILYGLPGPDLLRDREEGWVALGGCIVDDDDMPAWECTGAERHRWGRAGAANR